MYIYLFNFSFNNIYNAKYLIENFKNLAHILKSVYSTRITKLILTCIVSLSKIKRNLF